MTGADRLNDMLRLCEMRRRLAQQRLQVATDKEQQRAAIASEGRDHQKMAERDAEDYVARRFASADLGDGAAGFITSLALGHRHAEHEAFALATRAERLAQRHRDAVHDRHDAGRQLLRAEERLTQRSDLAKHATAAEQAENDEAEEEEGQEIRAGRAIHGLS